MDLTGLERARPLLERVIAIAEGQWSTTNDADSWTEAAILDTCYALQKLAGAIAIALLEDE